MANFFGSLTGFGAGGGPQPYAVDFLCVAGGGGGGSHNSQHGGGTGGGGTGARGSANVAGGNGTDALGGGGGGGSTPDVNSSRSGNGGKGVVILKVPAASYSGTTTGSPSVGDSGDYKILSFTGTGTYTA